MSGKPHPQGISQLAEQFRFLHNAQDEAVRLESIITDHTQKKAIAQDNAYKALAEIKRLMEEMDISSPGNMGYKDRLLWSLRELTVQSEQYGRTHL